MLSVPVHNRPWDFKTQMLLWPELIILSAVLSNVFWLFFCDKEAHDVAWHDVSLRKCIAVNNITDYFSLLALCQTSLLLKVFSAYARNKVIIIYSLPEVEGVGVVFPADEVVTEWYDEIKTYNFNWPELCQYNL